MLLDEHIRAIAENWGADFFGIADLTPARAFIVEQGGERLAQYPRAVSIGVALMRDIVDQLPQRDQTAVAKLYRAHAYDIVNARLDQISSRLASALQRAGYRALPIPASQVVDTTGLRGLFSHKLAAHLAGLGWIGKSCMLITPTVGPRARWATVLTDAPLLATGQGMELQCGDCRQCADICPVGAYSGRLFRADEPRALRFDADKCNAYLDLRGQSTEMRVCGMCLYICPHGRKGSEP